MSKLIMITEAEHQEVREHAEREFAIEGVFAMLLKQQATLERDRLSFWQRVRKKYQLDEAKGYELDPNTGELRETKNTPTPASSGS